MRNKALPKRQERTFGPVVLRRNVPDAYFRLHPCSIRYQSKGHLLDYQENKKYSVKMVAVAMGMQVRSRVVIEDYLPSQHPPDRPIPIVSRATESIHKGKLLFGPGLSHTNLGETLNRIE